MSIQDYYDQLCRLAEQQLVDIVRKALNKETNDHVSHAVCAMGKFFFVGDYAIYGTNSILHGQEMDICPKAIEFLGEWDDVCKLTGLGVKITRTSVEEMR